MLTPSLNCIVFDDEQASETKLALIYSSDLQSRKAGDVDSPLCFCTFIFYIYIFDVVLIVLNQTSYKKSVNMVRQSQEKTPEEQKRAKWEAKWCNPSVRHAGDLCLFSHSVLLISWSEGNLLHVCSPGPVISLSGYNCYYYLQSTVIFLFFLFSFSSCVSSFCSVVLSVKRCCVL